MNKFATILGAGAFALSTTAIADVQFADPEEGGIGYEWTVSLGHHGSAEIIGSTGGKGSFEPAFEAPDIGWTHTTDWVALDLEAEVVLEIKITRQEGVYELKVDRETGAKSYATSGAMLYPAMSIYEGWDSTTEKEKGSFNPIGNFWSTIQFKAAEFSAWGEDTIVYRAKLPAGKYSVNIGGVNAMYCSETDDCYKGVHGYRATFTASHVPAMSM
ncbi:hypothetical protein [Methyloprofundus sp.]|uniref:hypothetical protein n=1 Tax=Methyloprofundus sp. TaxID=2020875 RepID=UPI003D0DCB40